MKILLASAFAALALVASASDATVVSTEARAFSDKDFAAAVETAVSKGHPRLLASSEDFTKVRNAKAATLRAIAADRLVVRAKALVPAKPLDRKMTGRRLLGVSRSALYRISTLSMAYRLTDDAVFLDRAKAELKSVCSFSDWNPSHFLDVGEMSLAVSIGYDWLYDALSEQERGDVRTALMEKGVAPAFKAQQSRTWWIRASNNWGQVCRAGLIAAALSVADDESMRPDCAKMLRDSVEALPISMKAMAPDGCYPEGLGYWHYGVSFNVFAIAMLESACGTDFGLSSLPGFWKTADYPNMMTGPLGHSVGYSDCGSSRAALQTLWWFAGKLNRPDLISAKEIEEWTRPASVRHSKWLPPIELVWMDDRKPEVVPSSAPLVWSARGSVPIATLRSGWGREDAFVGLKGGSPSSNHGHMDGGNFVLDMGGVRWAWELPCEEYNRIEQMKTVSLWSMKQDSSRWSLLRLNTFGHNVPSIEAAQQSVKGFAKFLSVDETPDSRTAVIDITSLYPAATNATRTARLSNDGRKLSVEDSFEGLKPGSKVRWQFLTKSQVNAKGGALSLRESGRAVLVTRSATGSDDWSVAPAEGPKPLNSPNPGVSIASFGFCAGVDGYARAAVVFELDGNR